MSQRERTGVRDMIYSRWHRPELISRYLRLDQAVILDMIDIDACESCHFCKRPLALIETKESRATSTSAYITSLLAQMAGVPGYLVFYTATDSDDISEFRVQQVAPVPGALTVVTPQAYAEWLLSLRDAHTCTGYQRWTLTRRDSATDVPCCYCHKPGCTFCLGPGWLPERNEITAAWIDAATKPEEAL
jgi:hypothetical protein